MRGLPNRASILDRITVTIQPDRVTRLVAGVCPINDISSKSGTLGPA
jgi:hypothetical protein